MNKILTIFSKCDQDHDGRLNKMEWFKFHGQLHPELKYSEHIENFFDLANKISKKDGISTNDLKYLIQIADEIRNKLSDANI